jgi:hypothetical protein
MGEGAARALLRFLYTEVTNVDPEFAVSALIASDRFQLPLFKAKIEKVIESFFDFQTPNDVLDILSVAKTFSAHGLYNICMHKLVYEFERQDVLKSSSWKEIPLTEQQYLLSRFYNPTTQ